MWPFSKNKSKKETSIENKMVNETVFEALNRSVNATSATIISKQNMSMNGIKFICKDPKIKQISKMDVKVLSKFDGKDSANLMDDIMNKLDGKIDDSMKQVSGMLGIGGGNQSNQSTKVKNDIRNSLKKSITNETINTVASQVVVDQDLKLENLVVDPCGMNVGLKAAEKLLSEGKMSFKEFREATKEPCDALCGEFTQDVLIKFVAEQIGSKISEVVANNKTVQDIQNKIDSKQSQKTKGVGDVAKDVGTGVGDAARGVGEGVGAAAGGMMWPFVIGGIICVVIIVAAVMMFKQDPNKAALMMSKISKK